MDFIGNEKPLVSVIMTVRNGASTLPFAIDSILKQTYHNLELVIVDDDSCDNSISIMGKYAEQDSRVRYLKSKSPGRARSLNLALNESSGDFICNLDCDDIFHPDKVRKQISAIKSNRGVGIIGTDSYLFSSCEEFDFPDNGFSGSVINVSRGLLTKNPINHSSVMFARSIIPGLLRYDEKQQRNIDYDLWCRAVRSGFDLWCINEKLTAKRIHSGQSFENKKRFRYIVSSYSKRAAHAVKTGNYHYIPVVAVLFLLSGLPWGVRLWIKKALGKGG